MRFHAQHRFAGKLGDLEGLLVLAFDDQHGIGLALEIGLEIAMHAKPLPPLRLARQ